MKEYSDTLQRENRRSGAHRFTHLWLFVSAPVEVKADEVKAVAVALSGQSQAHFWHGTIVSLYQAENETQQVAAFVSDCVYEHVMFQVTATNGTHSLNIRGLKEN